MCFYKCHFRAILHTRKCPDTPLSLRSIVYRPRGCDRIMSADHAMLLNRALCLAPSLPWLLHTRAVRLLEASRLEWVGAGAPVGQEEGQADGLEAAGEGTDSDGVEWALLSEDLGDELRNVSTLSAMMSYLVLTYRWGRGRSEDEGSEVGGTLVAQSAGGIDEGTDTVRLDGGADERSTPSSTGGGGLLGLEELLGAVSGLRAAVGVTKERAQNGERGDVVEDGAKCDGRWLDRWEVCMETGLLAMNIRVVDEAAQAQTNNGWAAAAARRRGRHTVEGVDSRHLCCCDVVYLRDWRFECGWIRGGCCVMKMQTRRAKMEREVCGGYDGMELDESHATSSSTEQEWKEPASCGIITSTTRRPQSRAIHRNNDSTARWQGN